MPPVIYDPDLTSADVTGLHVGQYELGGLKFGTRSPWIVQNNYLVQSFDITEGGATVGDVPYPNEDGTKFGVDFNTGQTLTFDMSVWMKGEQGYDAVSLLQSMWKHPKWRKIPNSVTTLRMNRGGRTRRVYGRPRRFKPTYGAIERGWAPITADFQCADESFYDDLETVHEIGLANPPTAGLVLPTTVPLHLESYAAAYTNITVEGDKPTWPVFTIEGPVTNPSFTFDNDWTVTLLISLTHQDVLSIDTRPWARLTLQNGTINRSGYYSSTSPILREIAMEPGLHDIVYNGIDVTLTSKLTIGWRSAWSTP
jgi:hypothetical protein